MASPILELETAPTQGATPLDLPSFAPALRSPSLATYWRTLRPLRWSQIADLIRHRLFRRWLIRGILTELDPVRLALPVGILTFPEWRPTEARRILETGEFHFLHTPTNRNKLPPWSGQDLPRLWAYHLHYCDYLNIDLTRVDDRFLLERAVSLMLDWCKSNTNGSGVGWEPYPLSLRIVNWLKFLLRNGSHLKAAYGGPSLSRILQSLCQQTCFLEHQLEFHLRGNHLLKNAKALLFAGGLLESRQSWRWLKTGARLLESQLAEQVLTDGGHFERSPMYHAQTLEDLLDIEALAASFNPLSSLRPPLSKKIDGMACFLEALLHPDGEIPLFSDSTLGDVQPAHELIQRSRSFAATFNTENRETTVLPESGYGILRDRPSQSCLIFDCGPLGPDEQPGHGHCDALSYELSLAGIRVVVDTGVSTYEAGLVRHYERSTAAHNTIRVDGEEQAEIWASFRVGRRYHTSPIDSGCAGQFSFLHGEHDGYRRIGVTHSRQIIHGPDNLWVIVDHLRGTGIHRIESFIHFHPEIAVEPCRPNGDLLPSGWCKRFLLSTPRRRYVLVSSPLGLFTAKEAWYSPEFGVRQNLRVGCWTWEGRLPVQMIYAFVPLGQLLPSIALSPEVNTLRIEETNVPLS